jgi:hypothetical protein
VGNLCELVTNTSKQQDAAAEDDILMPQPLNLVSGGGGTLLIHRQMRTLLHACPDSVVLEVEQVLRVPGQ